MKILCYSSAFYPAVGGLETVVYTLAHEFVRQGHQVRVLTQTPAQAADHFPFEVIRNPSKDQYTQTLRWCDVHFQACISLKALWPALLVPKRLFVTHQTWYRRIEDSSVGWQDRLKLLMTRFTVNFSISQAIARHIPAKSYIIPNPYQSGLFGLRPEIKRDREIVFLGRLVSDKGVDLLLEALVRLKAKEIPFRCTIVGEGPEKANLESFCQSNYIADAVTFAGIKTGEALVQLLNAHQIMVVPSRWAEPFGIVALEGIACGNVVVGSQGGGLADAIGDCGLTFPNGNVEELTKHLELLLMHREELDAYRRHAATHLQRHTAAQISAAYLRIFAHELFPENVSTPHAVPVFTH